MEEDTNILEALAASIFTLKIKTVLYGITLQTTLT
jgi:hypothetical protein